MKQYVAFKNKKPILHNNSTILKTSLNQLLFTNLPMLLHYEDRNSMAFSIEARAPFLDYRLVEFIHSLPDETKIHNGETKYILRKSMANILPVKILNRFDKMGFVTPEEVWLKENPEKFKQELQNTVELSKGFISQNILSYFEKMVEGKKPFNFSIWRFIVFGRWLKVFNVQIND